VKEKEEAGSCFVLPAGKVTVFGRPFTPALSAALSVASAK
jgi:hypothetical protein